MRREYLVVTHNGSGVHFKAKTLARAKEAAARLAASAVIDFGSLEIERRTWIHDYAYRPHVREGSKWVPWDARRDIDERRPDWMWPCGIPKSHVHQPATIDSVTGKDTP